MNKKHKLFNFIDVFNYQRGERLIEVNQVPGEIALITSSKENNGVGNYITPPEGMIVYENKLTLSNSGSVGYMFYHDYPFVASDHVTVIWPKEVNLNKNISLYLKPIFEKMKHKYGFGREISNPRLENEEILLPVDNENNLDWDYMNIYIENLKKEIEFKKRFEDNHIKQILNTENWKLFNFDEVFDIDKGEGPNIKWAKENKGDTPLISSTKYNNGIAVMVNYETTHSKKTITVASNGSVGSAFYQEKPYCATGDVNVLTPKFKINKYIALFFITLIESEKHKFGYGRKWGARRMRKSQFKLPIKNNKINFKFMEEFIKNTNYSKYIKEET